MCTVVEDWGLFEMLMIINGIVKYNLVHIEFLQNIKLLLGTIQKSLLDEVGRFRGGNEIGKLTNGGFHLCPKV